MIHLIEVHPWWAFFALLICLTTLDNVVVNVCKAFIARSKR
jgi:hypothetical protein